MAEQLKEIVIVSKYGASMGDAFNLAFLVTHPFIDVKLLCLEVEDPMKSLPPLFEFLKAQGCEIPLAIKGSSQEVLHSLLERENYNGHLFPSFEKALSSVLPRMNTAGILATAGWQEINETLSSLHLHKPSLTLGPACAKEAINLGSMQANGDGLSIFDPELRLRILTDSLDSSIHFTDGEWRMLNDSSAPASKFLLCLIANLFEEERSVFSLDNIASSWVLGFPKNFDFEIRELTSGDTKKDLIFVTGIHRINVMKEVVLGTLLENKEAKSELQIVERAGRYRISYPSFQASKSLFVYEVGWEKHQPGDHYGPVSRDYHFLHAIIEGEGYLTIEGVKRKVQKGDVFVVPAEILSKIEADPQDPYQYCWVGFGGKDANALLQSCGFSIQNGFIIQPPNFKEIKEVLLSMARIERKNIGTPYWLLGQLYIAFSLLSFERPSQEFRRKDFVKEAIEYMDEEFSSGISISEVAKKIHVERTYFFRRFKKEIGVSPSDYLLGVRLEKAKDLLRNSNLSIASIAKAVGYNNYVTFTESFTKKMGLRPSEYRKKALPKNNG